MGLTCFLKYLKNAAKKERKTSSWGSHCSSALWSLSPTFEIGQLFSGGEEEERGALSLKWAKKKGKYQNCPFFPLSIPLSQKKTREVSTFPCRVCKWGYIFSRTNVSSYIYAACTTTTTTTTTTTLYSLTLYKRGERERMKRRKERSCKCVDKRRKQNNCLPVCLLWVYLELEEGDFPPRRRHRLEIKEGLNKKVRIPSYKRKMKKKKRTRQEASSRLILVLLQ